MSEDCTDLVCRQKGPGVVLINDDRGVGLEIPVGCWVTACRTIELLEQFGEPTPRPAGATQIAKGVLNASAVIVWEDASSVKIKVEEDKGHRQLEPQRGKADPVVDDTPVTTAIMFVDGVAQEKLREQIDAVQAHCPLTTILAVCETTAPEPVNGTPAMTLIRSCGGRYLPVQKGEAWQAIAASIEDSTRWLLIFDPGAAPLAGVLEPAATLLDVDPTAGCVSLRPSGAAARKKEPELLLPDHGSAIVLRSEILRSLLDERGIALISEHGVRGVALAAATNGWRTIERQDLVCAASPNEKAHTIPRDLRTEAMKAIKERAAAAPSPKVTIVVTVHDALRATLFTLRSLADVSPGGNLKPDVIVMDDCSEKYVGARVKEFCAAHGFGYSRNRKNEGYSKTVMKGIEIGLKKNKASWLCLLNSDTVVTAGWLWRLVRVGVADDRVGMVGPYSNSAVHASLPVQPGDDPQCFAEKIAYASKRYLPDVPTPTGFCLLIRKETWEECGPFDVAYYGKAYGEETDFWAVAMQKGWRAVLADDAFVRHENHASHGLRGKALERRASELFLARHEGLMRAHYGEYTKILNSKIHYIVHRLHSGPSDRRKRICYLINDYGVYGGVFALANICNRLSMLGWDARIATIGVTKSAINALPVSAYPIEFNSHSDMINDFAAKVFTEGVVCATVWNTAAMAAAIAEELPGVRAASFVQDLESEFVDRGGKKMAADSDVWSSYDLIHPKIVNSAWVKEEMETVHGAKGCELIPVGVDMGVFHPRKKGTPDPTVLFFYRPDTPYRGEAMVRAVAERLAAELPDVRLVSFGGTGDNLPGKLEQKGKISQEDAARLYAHSSVFLEASTSQGFGLQGLEAMASDCVLVSTRNKGIDNYGVDGENCLLVDVGDVDAAVAAIKTALNNAALREKLIKNGRKTAADHDWWSIAERHAEFYSRVLNG